jgi:hypothetical protein
MALERLDRFGGFRECLGPGLGGGQGQGPKSGKVGGHRKMEIVIRFEGWTVGVSC